MEHKSSKSYGLGLWKCFCHGNQESAAAEEVVEKRIHGIRPVISREEDDDQGVVRVKIVMSKKELKQIVASMSECHGGADGRRMAAVAPQSLEQLLHLLRSRHMVKGRKSGWMPALQSIPEEP